MTSPSPSSLSQSALPRRSLGESGQLVSVLGLGCASYWAKPRFSESQAKAVLNTALEAGITVLDTGASYARGHAEHRLGRLLKDLGADPQTLLIGTKAGTEADPRGRLRKNFHPAAITAQVDDSLRTLGLERLPLLQLHGPEVADLTDDLYTTLERLRTDGKVGLLGLNGFTRVITHIVTQHNTPRAGGSSPFDVLMPFLSVLDPHMRPTIAAAARAGRGVLVAGPLARMAFAPPLAHWLTRPSGLWYLARVLRHGPKPILQARRLRPALTADGWTPAQLAMAWVLEQPGVTCAVFGTTRPDHIRALAQAAHRPLPPSVRTALQRLHGGAPITPSS